MRSTRSYRVHPNLAFRKESLPYVKRRREVWLNHGVPLVDSLNVIHDLVLQPTKIRSISFYQASVRPFGIRPCVRARQKTTPPPIHSPTPRPRCACVHAPALGEV